MGRLIPNFMKEKREMPSLEEGQSQFVKNSVLYKEFLAERAEILKHKWIESEKAGKESGSKRHLDWIVKHAPVGESDGQRRRAPKSPPPNFCSFKAILRGRKGSA